MFLKNQVTKEVNTGGICSFCYNTAVICHVHINQARSQGGGSGPTVPP